MHWLWSYNAAFGAPVVEPKRRTTIPRRGDLPSGTLFSESELNWSMVLNMSISLITLRQNRSNFPAERDDAGKRGGFLLSFQGFLKTKCQRGTGSLSSAMLGATVCLDFCADKRHRKLLRGISEKILDYCSFTYRLRFHRQTAFVFGWTND